MMLFGVFIFFAGMSTVLFLNQKQFGKKPKEFRLQKIKQSPHYANKQFQNQSFTPPLTEGFSMSKIMFEFLFKNFPRTRPNQPIPSVKIDLKALPKNEDLLVWFGHSSYFIQLDGLSFLIDPVFSGNASPIKNTNKSFQGSDIYSVNDLPSIDYLLITHDHYDHLDYPTIKQLKGKFEKVICGLGVGEHLELWGIDSTKIIEKDWYEEEKLNNDIQLFTAPTRHFSGRLFHRNNTLWLSFVLKSSKLKLYLGGDSGYDRHFKELGEKFGFFDLAILDNGQYNVAWQAIHMLPSEGLQAARDLNAKRLFPAHSSKFKLANHPWDEPLNTITQLHQKDTDCPIITPKIGEVVYLNNENQEFIEWWKEIK